jgi:MFS transporter, DHA1 family, tetracycline resistance protein
MRGLDPFGSGRVIPRNLGLLIGALFLWSIGEGLFFIFQPLFLASFGASPFQIGVVLGLASLSLVLVHLPAGYIADRMGRKPVILCGWWLGLCSACTMFLAPDLILFSAALILYYATAFVGSANNSYLTAARGTLSIERAITLAAIAYGAGSVFSPAIGGWMAAHWGLRSTIGVACLLYAASCLVVLMLAPQPSAHDSEKVEYRGLLKNPAFQKLALLTFGASMTMYLSMALAPNFLQDSRGVTIEQIGLFGSAAAIGIVLLNAVIGRWRPRNSFLLAQAMLLAQTVLLWLGNGLGWFLIAFFLRSGFSGMRASAASQTGRIVSHREMGVAYAAMETMIASATMIASLLAGYLYERQTDLPLIVSAGLGIAMLGLSIWFAPADSGHREKPIVPTSGALLLE